MKHIFTLVLLAILFQGNAKAQHYIYHYNPYSGYNEAQLELALEHSTRMKRNGIIATTIGTGLMAGGSVFMFNSLFSIAEEDFNPVTFGVGVGALALGTFPFTFGLVGWLTGNEQIKQIEIQLLASEKGNLNLQPTENGYGLVYSFRSAK